MTPWLALSLGLCLGQTPEVAPTDGSVQMPALVVGVPGDSLPPQPASSTGSAQGSTGNVRRDVANLSSQVQSLQEQLEENTARTTQLQQQLTGIQERAQELERMRQQRLSGLERARDWLVAADQALAVGELAVGDALSEADSALAQVLDSATAAGNGQTASLVEDARGFISQALESTGHRDSYQARDYLFFADWLLQAAQRRNLDASSATVVTQ